MSNQRVQAKSIRIGNQDITIPDKPITLVLCGHKVRIPSFDSDKNTNLNAICSTLSSVAGTHANPTDVYVLTLQEDEAYIENLANDSIKKAEELAKQLEKNKEAGSANSCTERSTISVTGSSCLHCHTNRFS